jgi:hypothetical protein
MKDRMNILQKNRDRFNTSGRLLLVPLDFESGDVIPVRRNGRYIRIQINACIGPLLFVRRVDLCPKSLVHCYIKELRN